MTIQLWQHMTSGDVFAVETDESGKVIAVSDALHWREQAAALDADGIDGSPEDVEWINEHAEEFRLKDRSECQE